MDFKNPIVAYTANGNLEAHSVVIWLESNGVQAYAVEDNSGVSLFQLGTLSQFHKPKVFVDKSNVDRAGELLRQFEAQRSKHRKKLDAAAPITSECEECGAASEFPASQDGKNQNCPKCNSFMDVGILDWPDDYDEPDDAEMESGVPVSAEDVMEAAARLDKIGEWDDAIAAYQDAAQRWPEHETYLKACIAAIERKRDAGNA